MQVVNSVRNHLSQYEQFLLVLYRHSERGSLGNDVAPRIRKLDPGALQSTGLPQCCQQPMVSRSKTNSQLGDPICALLPPVANICWMDTTLRHLARRLVVPDVAQIAKYPALSHDARKQHFLSLAFESLPTPPISLVTRPVLGRKRYKTARKICHLSKRFRNPFAAQRSIPTQV